MAKGRKSFFGGDPNVSHFSASVRYKKPDESHDEAAIRRRAQYKKLRELGWANKYFKFRDGDKAGKERAKKAAEKFATEWNVRSGVEFEVSQGFFL